jgi:hypothetical protein
MISSVLHFINTSDYFIILVYQFIAEENLCIVVEELFITIQKFFHLQPSSLSIFYFAL